MGEVTLMIIQITSLSQFIEEISSIELEREQRMFPPKLVFRGQSSINYKLSPSLARRPAPNWFNSLAFVEKDLVQSAQQKFPLLFPYTDYPVILLAKLQHYGIPTRLMDLSENALVALYFACCSNFDIDGEVFAFSAQMCSAYDPVANAIADTCRLTGNSVTPFENYYYRVTKQTYSARLLYPNWENNMEAGKNHLMRLMQKPMFIEAGNVCERQKHQSGMFMLFPNSVRDKKMMEGELVGISKEDKCIVKRFAIAKEFKQVILSQLCRFGITEQFLFSDNVDAVLRTVVAEQKQRYS